MTLARVLASHFERCQRKNSLRVNGQGVRQELEPRVWSNFSLRFETN